MRKLRKNEILVLRVNSAANTSYGGFKYPSSGVVTAPDWDGKAECGGGLHGLPCGVGSGSLLNWEDGKLAILIIVNTSTDYFEFEEKCKFQRGEVVFTGTMFDAVTILQEHYPDKPIVYAHKQAGNYGTATAGDGGTATAGFGGTATAGDYGAATAGNYGTATAGFGGTATAGDGGTATAGYRGTATAGNYGTATAGDGGTATAGDGGTATAGFGGTATAGDYGAATAGNYGTATAGFGGTATAGDGGTLVIKHWDVSRFRLYVGYVGEDCIKPNTPYHLVDGKLVEVRND